MTASGSHFIAAPSAQGVRHGTVHDLFGDAQRGAAWQKEMERAQLASWFKADGALVNGGSGSSLDVSARPSQETMPANSPCNAAGVTTRNCSPSNKFGEIRPFVSLSSAIHSSSIYGTPVFSFAAKNVSESGEAHRVDGPVVMPVASKHADPVLSLSIPGCQIFLDDEVIAGISTAAEQGPMASQTQRISKAPLSIHMESQGDSVSIWIGVLAGDSGALIELPTVLNDIQKWLASCEKSIQQIFCNGKPLWQLDATRKSPSDVVAGETISIGEEMPEAQLCAYGSKQNRKFSWEIPYGR